MKEAVMAERERRGWSVRKAAQAGGVSNMTWSRFEESGNLTGRMRQAVADAFGWPLGWPNGDHIDETAIEPAGPDVVELATELRHSLAKSSSRDEKLAAILAAATEALEVSTAVSAQVRANQEQLALIAKALDVRVVPAPSGSR